MDWLTYAAYAAMLAGVLPLLFMSVGYFYMNKRREKRDEEPREIASSEKRTERMD